MCFEFLHVVLQAFRRPSLHSIRSIFGVVVREEFQKVLFCEHSYTPRIVVPEDEAQPEEGVLCSGLYTGDAPKEFQEVDVTITIDVESVE